MSYFAIGTGARPDQALTDQLDKGGSADAGSMHGTIKNVTGVIAGAVLLMLGACSDSSNSGAGPSSDGSQDHALGVTSMTFVDTSRPTAAHGPAPEAPSRTIETTIVYPVQGTSEEAVTPDAPVDRWAAPYPLVVLAHGLGGSVEHLLPLAEVWAARGYVVALPRFPLTNSSTPGGPAGEDVQNQPGDVSFVIDEILAESDTSGRLLSNSVDSNKIAASGHSNGGITTYGLVANSCCRDPRIPGPRSKPARTG
mgnify:CR=1 FL=1